MDVDLKVPIKTREPLRLSYLVISPVGWNNCSNLQSKMRRWHHTIQHSSGRFEFRSAAILVF
jgi:hypothetical protein